jgi:hypothetical protein
VVRGQKDESSLILAVFYFVPVQWNRSVIEIQACNSTLIRLAAGLARREKDVFFRHPTADESAG